MTRSRLEGEFTGAIQDSAATDGIQLPACDAFIGTPTSTAAESYYSTLLHELTHNADIRIMPRRCHLPWSSLAEGCRHSAKFQPHLITALGGKPSLAQAALKVLAIVSLL